METQEERLYGLMEIAERQQAAVKAMLDGLEVERKALVQERHVLADKIAALEVGVHGAAKQAITESLANVAVDGVAAVKTATDPLLSKLNQVEDKAVSAEASLQRIISVAGWRLLAKLGALVVVLVLAGWLAGMVIVWWEDHRISALKNQISQLQANRDSFVKEGMLGQITYCDPGNRPCIEIDESAGTFGAPNGPQDYMVIKGY